MRSRCSPARALEMDMFLFRALFPLLLMALSLSLVDAGTNIQTNEEVAIKLVRALSTLAAGLPANLCYILPVLDVLAS